MSQGPSIFVTERSELYTVHLRNSELMEVEQAIELGNGKT